MTSAVIYVNQHTNPKYVKLGYALIIHAMTDKGDIAEIIIGCDSFKIIEQAMRERSRVDDESTVSYDGA
jgi:hypothetical protein